MSFIDSIYEKARFYKKRVVIPECTNELMMRAAMRALEAGFAEIIFVGDPADIEAASLAYNVDLTGVKIVDIGDEAYKEQLIESYAGLSDKILSKKSVARRIGEPLYMALVMQVVGDADCTLAGLDTTTYEFILAASGIIGQSEGVSTASAFVLMEIEGFEGEQGNCFGMSDGAICLEPTSEQLAEIAISCCDTFSALMGREARCAMLSSSTLGSGSGAPVTRIREAVALAKARRPDLMIDGEFQSDAAILKQVADKKIKRPSDVAGRADVLIFPDVAACNIGSKLVQIFANARSYGPIYQGFKQPFIDCSRGDTEDRLFDNIALCSVLAAHQGSTEEVCS